MWSKGNKTTRLLGVVCAIVLVVLCAVLVVGLLLPYQAAKSTMASDGTLLVQSQQDGSVLLQWPQGENAEGYELQILTADGTVLHTETTTGCSAVLPQLPENQDLTVQIFSTHDFGTMTRKSGEALEADICLPVPQIQNLSWQPDDAQDTVDITFDMPEGDTCSVYVAQNGGEPVLHEQLQKGQLQLRFGVDDAYAVPERGETLEVSFLLERTAGNVTYRSEAEPFTLERDHFLSSVVDVQSSYLGNNTYTFTWNETKGAYYDVRFSEDGGATWQTMAYIPADHERTYTTPSLKAFTDYQISVVAVGGTTMPDSEFDAQSPVMELSTHEKLQYSTIWPLIDQKVYADAQATVELGTIPAGSAWCVLGMDGRYMKIRYQGQDAYVDSEYCMINLTEYLGNLCQYDMKNSYSSIYLVHEYGIDDVSGTVIEGYENVRVGEDTYLVPLLYPVAQKLMVAGQRAKNQGYTLKIYDSYRPQIATESIYTKTSLILSNLVPDHTFDGQPKEMVWEVWDPNTGDWAEPVPISGRMSYRRLMTNNGREELSSFLAPGISRHNYGLALDLTLVDSNGNEVAMQSSMHDLSWHSLVTFNNANANFLRELMIGAGFKGISSEWWHFQDQEAYIRNAYLPLRTGVSWECWVADNNGWRYRQADGSYVSNCTQTIDGESYTFDENGYIVK